MKRVKSFFAMLSVLGANAYADKLPEISSAEVEKKFLEVQNLGYILIGGIIGIVLLIGLVRAIYKVQSGKHDSYDGIIAWSGGLLMYIIGAYIVNQFI